MKDEFMKPVLTVVFGFVVYLILSMIFYSSAVLLFGLYGAILYAAQKYRKFNEQIIIAVVILVLDILFHLDFFGIRFLISEVLIIAGLFISFWLYLKYMPKFNKIPIFVRALILLVIFAVIFWIVFIIDMLIYNISTIQFNIHLLHFAKYYGFLGLFLGLGFDLYEFLDEKKLLKF